MTDLRNSGRAAAGCREEDPVLAASELALETLNAADEAISLVDLGAVRRQYEKWCANLPQVTPFYAVKCNPDVQLLKTLRDLGSSFDCATQAEFDLVLSLGVSADRVVFSHPCKPRGHLRAAKEAGVSLMVFDNETELRKIAEESGGKARLLLRIICEDSHTQCPMSNKFGAGQERWALLLRTAKQLGLALVGASFHVGSGCQEAGAFDRALSDAARLFDMAESFGFEMQVLDIGGGFPGTDEGAKAKFADIAKTITAQLEMGFPKARYPELRLIAEPGRFFAASCQALLTKVFAKTELREHPFREFREEEPRKLFRYYLNDGLYGAFNCVLYDHAEVTPERLPSFLRRKAEESESHKCCVFGPTCDGFDMILKDYSMPELEEGEWLLWRNMGAYTTAAGSTFNGFLKPISWYYRTS